MPVCGLRITLCDEPIARAEALRVLGQDSRCELGPERLPFVAVVTVTETPAEQRDLHDRLLAVPGVIHVDVVFVEVEERSLYESVSSSALELELRS